MKIKKHMTVLIVTTICLEVIKLCAKIETNRLDSTMLFLLVYLCIKSLFE